MKTEYDKLKKYLGKYDDIVSKINRDQFELSDLKKAKHIRKYVDEELNKLKGILNTDLIERIGNVLDLIEQNAQNTPSVWEKLIKDLI